MVRHPGTLMLPVPQVAGRMRQLIDRHEVDTVWFGAAAPLALMAPLARDAGVGRVVASTHGHEVGWSMLPLARTALRRIGTGTDVVTYSQSLHARPVRIGVRPDAALEHLPPGVDTDRFAPDEVPAPSCVPGTGWGSGRWWSVCRGWCRARDRTC